jgi:hypothetical protein
MEVPMKNLLTALCLVSLAAPAAAMSIDTSTLTPTLTYPEPVSEPVTKDKSSMSK